MGSKYRDALPQLRSKTAFLTEGGIETTLVYKHRYDLPHFAAFPLLESAAGRKTLRDCYVAYVDVARASETGIILETPTWRASRPWVVERLGSPEAQIVTINRDGVRFIKEIRDRYETETTPVVISGTLGPLGDAYRRPSETTLEAARACYHDQVQALAHAGADMLGMMTLTTTTEAIAGVQLAHEFGLPIMVSFTLETDGRLLDGRGLAEVIAEVDGATDGYAVYFGINCSHPSHFIGMLRDMDPALVARLGEVRANASMKSHEELDKSESLDRGDPVALGDAYTPLRTLLPGLVVVGGCCGTDEEHLSEIASRLVK